MVILRDALLDSLLLDCPLIEPMPERREDDWDQFETDLLTPDYPFPLCERSSPHVLY